MAARCTIVVRRSDPKALDVLDDADVAALREVKMRAVLIAGDAATAQLEGRSDPVKLTRHGGRWKIARLQFRG